MRYVKYLLYILEHRKLLGVTDAQINYHQHKASGFKHDHTTCFLGCLLIPLSTEFNPIDM